jgi:hypothetical protein
MGFISIHDTHKLPYFNATITAKTKQSGNTTPLKFKTCLDGTEIGYEVYTNARGYLCDGNGNLYTDSVCVDEDAYITATLGDGSSTSWIVRLESDITVNDGMLLGKAVDEADKEPGKDYVLIEGAWRVLLHSANTDKNRTLPLGDLDEVPPINEWKETQDVFCFNSQNTSYNISEYAKSLIIQWEGAAPAYPQPIAITLGYENANNRSRYAQQVMVYNATPYAVKLIDRNSGDFIGIVNPGRSINIGLFFRENQTNGNWLYDGDRYDDWYKLEVTQSSVVPAGANNGISIVITDRTPGFIKVTMGNGASLSGASPRQGEVPIILSTTGTSCERDIEIQYVNVSTGNAATLPAVVKSAGQEICVIHRNRVCKLHVPKSDAGFTPANNVILLDNYCDANNTYCSIAATGGGSFIVPKNCDVLNITAPGNGETVKLYFHSDNGHYTRVSLTTSGSFTRLQLCNDTDTFTQYEMVVGKVGNFGVRNSMGLLYVDGYEVDGDYSCDWDNGYWYADFTQHYANKVDFTKMGFVTGHKYGEYNSDGDHPKNDLIIKIPLSDTQDGTFSVTFTPYAAHTRGTTHVVRFYAQTTNGTRYSIDADVLDDIFINGGEYKYSKNGSSITRIY